VFRSGGLGLHGLPKSTCFDRIDVSNIIDSEYVGISNVLADWTPLLSKTNRCATILGYSMNWVPKQADSGPGPEAVKRLADQLIHMGKASEHVPSPSAVFDIPNSLASQRNRAYFLPYGNISLQSTTTRMHSASISRNKVLKMRLAKPASSSSLSIPSSLMYD